MRSLICGRTGTFVTRNDAQVYFPTVHERQFEGTSGVDCYSEGYTTILSYHILTNIRLLTVNAISASFGVAAALV